MQSPPRTWIPAGVREGLGSSLREQKGSVVAELPPSLRSPHRRAAAWVLNTCVEIGSDSYGAPNQEITNVLKMAT